MKNTCNYSDNWQPYIGDYDKLEYDIKLKSGKIIECCYPNAGEFRPFNNESKFFNEADIAEIRFSAKPVSELNYKYSEACRQMLGKEVSKDLPKKQQKILVAATGNFTSHKRDINEGQKQQRNDKCYCGSGKKYKNCCINK